MALRDSKYYWWAQLAGSAGMCLFLLVLAVGTVAGGGGADLLGVAELFALIGEGFIVAIAVRNLRRCYAEFPAAWTGRWQVSLSDLLSIAFVFGGIMAAAKTIFEHNFHVVLPLCLFIGIGYAISLLFVSRMFGNLAPIARWFSAWGLFAAVLFHMAVGMAVHFVGLAVAVILFCH